MDDLGRAFALALDLIVRLDPDFVGIVLLSLKVSLTATAVGFALGAPTGAALAMTRFRGRGIALILVNALLGLPPVVVGLVVYLVCLDRVLWGPWASCSRRPRWSRRRPCSRFRS